MMFDIDSAKELNVWFCYGSLGWPPEEASSASFPDELDSEFDLALPAANLLSSTFVFEILELHLALRFLPLTCHSSMCCLHSSSSSFFIYSLRAASAAALFASLDISFDF